MVSSILQFSGSMDFSSLDHGSFAPFGGERSGGEGPQINWGWRLVNWFKYIKVSYFLYIWVCGLSCECCGVLHYHNSHCTFKLISWKIIKNIYNFWRLFSVAIIIISTKTKNKLWLGGFISAPIVALTKLLHRATCC